MPAEVKTSSPSTSSHDASPSVAVAVGGNGRMGQGGRRRCRAFGVGGGAMVRTRRAEVAGLGRGDGAVGSNRRGFKNTPMIGRDSAGGRSRCSLLLLHVAVLAVVMLIASRTMIIPAVHSFSTSPMISRPAAYRCGRWGATSRPALTGANALRSMTTTPLLRMSSGDDTDPSCESEATPNYTHLIGVPLEDNHDLLLELESVQRAILYHCPSLVEACIVPAVTRLPLLYVDASSSSSPSSGSSEGTLAAILDPGGKVDQVAERLNDIVTEVVDELVFVEPPTSSSDPSSEDGGSSSSVLEWEDEGGLNTDGIAPLMIPFKGLEIDGDDNSALFALGREDCRGTRLLGDVIDEISKRVEKEGWTVRLPPDEPQAGQERDVDGDDGEDQNIWRPRVPFMRLPPDFEENLLPLDAEDGSAAAAEVDVLNGGDAGGYRSPEEGGNGISPIFFYKYWDDEFTSKLGVRLREIAVYGRSPAAEAAAAVAAAKASSSVEETCSLDERAFYAPRLRTKLPEGNDMLTRSEERDRSYAEARLDGMEAGASAPTPNGSAAGTSNSDNGGKEWAEAERAVDSASSPQRARRPGEPIVRRLKVPPSARVESLSERLRRLRTESREGENLPSRPLLESMKASGTPAADASGRAKKTVLPPFPSEEHFVGIWRLVSTPKDSSSSADTPSDSTENIILRVDGTVAGGPVLDRELKQKCAGGSWKMFQARWAGGGNSPELEQTRLRMRLLIPPKREDELVMEGEVTRMMMPTGSSVSSISLPAGQVEPGAGGVVEELEQGLLHCGGEAWVENIKSGERRKLGRFSAMKLNTPDPSDLRYTVPPPRSGLQ